MGRRPLGTVAAAVALGLAAFAVAAADGARATGQSYPATGILRINGDVASVSSPAQYSYVILHSDQHALIPQLKAANPAVKVLVYKDAAATATWAPSGPHLPTGVAYTDANANHPEWFLTDTTGARIEWCDYPGDWQMDVGSAAYQNAWIAGVAADLKANGWDGVMIDDVNSTQAWHLCGRTIAKYPTDAEYAAAMRSFLARVGPALRNEGFLVLPNIYLPWSPDADRTWRDWISHTSGAVLEYWSKWGTGTTDHFAGADWTYRQQFLPVTQTAGKVFLGITYAPGTDVRSMRYARASFLLDWNGGPSALVFEPGKGTDPGSGEWTTDIGTPVGARYAVGAAWRRDYTGGTVVLNPSASSSVNVDLGRAYLLPDGTSVTTVALSPTTGIVLRSAPTTSASPPPATPTAPAPTTPPPPFTLTLATTTTTASVDLSWSGSAAAKIDVYRNGTRIATVANTGTYRDRLRSTTGTFTYKVCAARSTVCSNEAVARLAAARSTTSLRLERKGSSARHLPS